MQVERLKPSSFVLLEKIKNWCLLSTIKNFILFHPTQPIENTNVSIAYFDQKIQYIWLEIKFPTIAEINLTWVTEHFSITLIDRQSKECQLHLREKDSILLESINFPRSNYLISIWYLTKILIFFNSWLVVELLLLSDEIKCCSNWSKYGILNTSSNRIQCWQLNNLISIMVIVKE